MIRLRTLLAALLLAAHGAAGAAPTCGNSVLDSGETCDDGNSSNGDGCSSSCQVESGYECTLPIPPSTGNAVADGGFEGGTPNSNWTERSIVFANQVICSDFCGSGGARTGDWWAYLGGTYLSETASVEQQVFIGQDDRVLSFWLQAPGCDHPSHYMNLTIDGTEVFRINGADPICGGTEYVQRFIDLQTAPGGPYNDNASHAVKFKGVIVQTGGASSFFIDDVLIARGGTDPIPSVCTAFDTCFAEDFDPGASGLPTTWTHFEDGSFSIPWGTTDGAACSASSSADNFTGGAGEAACINSDGGRKATSSYVCSEPIDLSTASETRLRMLYNYQVKTPGADDAFDVLVGTATPSLATIGSYTPVFQAGAVDKGSAFSTPGAELMLDFSGFQGSTVHLCFHYGANGDYYAQVDDIEVRAEACGTVGEPPFAPASLAASDGQFAEFARIDWSDVSGETGYQVYRCTSATNTNGCVQIGGQPANLNTYDDYGADAGGATHYYRVKACNAAGCSNFSPADAGYRQTPPAQPTGISASDGTFIDFVRIAWNDVSSESEYRLFRCGNGTDVGTCIQIANRPAGTTSFDDLGANANGVTHFYRVRACNAAGCSTYSAADPGYRQVPLQPPPMPLGVDASDGTFTDFVRVSWNDVAGEDNYEVHRCGNDSDTGTCSVLDTAPGDASMYDDTTADPDGATHYYRVKACNTAGCSAFSAANGGHRQVVIEPPSTPPGVAATNGTFVDRIRINWNDVAGETYFQIFRKNDIGSWNYQANIPADQTLYDDFTADESGATESYIVRACNLGGCSPYSFPASGYRLTAPPVPIDVAATDGAYEDKVRVTWTDGPREDGYEVFRCATSGEGSCGEPIATLPANSSQFDDFNADAEGTHHFYRVKACNDAGCSPFSAYDEGFRSVPVPAVPGGLQATDGTFDDRVRVTWNDGSLEDNYEVYRCNNASTSSCEHIATPGENAAQHDDFGADAGGETHHYRVKACNSAGCSGYSDSDTGFRTTGLPDRIFGTGFEVAPD